MTLEERKTLVNFYLGKMVAAPEGIHFTQEEIANAVHFQEQYLEIGIDNINERQK